MCVCVCGWMTLAACSYREVNGCLCVCEREREVGRGGRGGGGGGKMTYSAYKEINKCTWNQDDFCSL